MVLNAELRMLNLNNARIMLNQVDTLADPTMADRFETASAAPSSPPASSSRPHLLSCGEIRTVWPPNGRKQSVFTATAEGTRHLCC